MDAEFFLDTALLRQHALELGEARRRVQELEEQLKIAQTYAEAEGDTSIRPLLEKVNTLDTYYDRLAAGLEDLCTEAEAVTQKNIEALEASSDRMVDTMQRHLPTE